MKNYDSWKSFVNTGKIDDYLHYIACTQEENMEEFIQGVDMSITSMDISMRNMDMPITSMGMPKTSLGRDKEGGFIAGINYRDGNGSFSHASW